MTGMHGSACLLTCLPARFCTLCSVQAHVQHQVNRKRLTWYVACTGWSIRHRHIPAQVVHLQTKTSPGQFPRDLFSTNNYMMIKPALEHSPTDHCCRSSVCFSPWEALVPAFKFRPSQPTHSTAADPLMCASTPPTIVLRDD
jgi:hypothetical protein